MKRRETGMAKELMSASENLVMTELIGSLSLRQEGKAPYSLSFTLLLALCVCDVTLIWDN
jgi:hypothetical protein